jgi:hypothetical protein
MSRAAYYNTAHDMRANPARGDRLVCLATVEKMTERVVKYRDENTVRRNMTHL